MTAGTVSTWNIPLNIPFVPDEVVLRQLTVGTTSNTGTIFQIATNLIDDQVLCSFIDTGNIVQYLALETRFNVRHQVNSSYILQVQNTPTNITTSSGLGPGTVASNVTGAFQIILEFVKY